MSEELSDTFQNIVNRAFEEARDGSAILEDLAPELEWVNLRDLIGEKICIISVQDAQPGLGDDALRVVYCGKDKIPFRFSSEHNVVIDQLRALKPYLPAWVKVAKAKSKKGMEYFILE